MRPAPADIEAVLARASVPPVVREQLVESYHRVLGSYRAARHDMLGGDAAAFCEWAYRALEWGVTRRLGDPNLPLPPDFLDKLDKLRPTKAFPEPDLRRLATALRCIRALGQPRGAATGVDPGAMDAAFAASAASWVVGELARLLGGLEPARAQAVVDGISALERPLTWEEARRLVAGPLKLQDKVLLVLYFRLKCPLKELAAEIPSHPAIAVAGVVTRPSPLLYHRRTDDTVEITPRGRIHVEERVLPRLRR